MKIQFYLVLVSIIIFSCSNNRINNNASAENKYPEEIHSHGNQSESDSVHLFFDVDEKPIMDEFGKPIYPTSARKKQIEGVVVITVTIDENGNVTKAEVFKSIPELDQAAVEAAKNCKFEPAVHKGKKVKVKMNVPFNFRLK